MIKAVFFDFYNTLISFDPPREELQAKACAEFGIAVEPEGIIQGYWHADDFMSGENARMPVNRRSPEEKDRFWAGYEQTILKTAGAEVTLDLALRIFTRVRQFVRRLVLFDDVLPAMDALKARNLILGLISNLDRSLETYCNELGIAGRLDFALSSADVGVEKPHPPIFLAALQRAGVRADEAVHVGDQYLADVVGARGVGITPLLLDRHGFAQHLNDCQKIRSLKEIIHYL